MLLICRSCSTHLHAEAEVGADPRPWSHLGGQAATEQPPSEREPTEQCGELGLGNGVFIMGVGCKGYFKASLPVPRTASVKMR